MTSDANSRVLLISATPMRLTIFTDYTLRVLIYLGTHSSATRLSTISDIASAYGISKNHLMKIVHHLGMQGYVETTRGKGGGMRLARPPGEIRIGDVVRSTGEEKPIVDCSDCALRPGCSLRGILASAMGAFFTVLDQHTLADLLPPCKDTPAIHPTDVNDPTG